MLINSTDSQMGIYKFLSFSERSSITWNYFLENQVVDVIME